MKEDWRNFWAGITTLTVADFILLTFDENPETVERQPDSRKRTTQILNAIESSRLEASFGYGVPVHRLLRPAPGIKPDQACLEHAANRMLLLSDALKFAVEVGKWEIPEWLHGIYLEGLPQSNGSHATEDEPTRAKARITELEAELERLKSMSQGVSAWKENASAAARSQNPALRDNSLIATIAALLAAWPGKAIPSAKDLERAAQSLNLTISDDTIRKALKAAQEAAPSLPLPK